MSAPIDPVKLAQEISRSKQQTEQNRPALLDIYAQIARAKKDRYDAYIKAGFKEAEALFLIANER